jgi:hypothetical protein
LKQDRFEVSILLGVCGGLGLGNRGFKGIRVKRKGYRVRNLVRDKLTGLLASY